MRCTAYCIAASYSLQPLLAFLKTLYPATLLYRDTIHATYAPDQGDLFFFNYGVLVTWGLTEEEELRVIESLKEYQIEPLPQFEKDEYELSYSDLAFKFTRDEIILTSRDNLTKLAISYGAAQSVKLALFERTINKTIAKTRHLPEDLARKGKISLSRKEISQKIGELFINRSSVNLHSDILDEPDFFWEYPEYNPLYREISKCLDFRTRVDVLNTRLGIVGELLGMLSDQLDTQHSVTLELTIIWLIVTEVVISLLRDLFHLI